MNRGLPSWFRTLHAQLLLALALIGLLPLSLVGIGVGLLDRRALVEQSSRELIGLARGLAGQVDLYMTARGQDSSAIASLPQIATMDPAAQTELLMDLFHEYPDFARISTFSLQGDRLASSYPGGVSSIAAREAFQATVRTGQQRWEITAIRSTGRASVVMNTPIRDQERRMVGVLGTVVDLESMSARLGWGQIGTGGQAFVLDSQGRVLLHTDPTVIQERRDYSGIGIPAGGRPAGPGTLSYETNGEARIAGFAPVEKAGFVAVVERPAADVVAPAERSWRLVLAGITATAVLALACAVALARMLSQPVRNLAVAAQALGAGDASVPLPSPDQLPRELDVLVRAFTAMRAQVVSREAALVENEARARSLLEQTPEAIVVLRHGRAVYVNPAGERLLGTGDPTPTLSSAVPGFVQSDDRPRGQPSENGPEREACAIQLMDARLVRPDGQTIDAEITIIPIQYDGAPANQVIVRDLTARKRAELERTAAVEARYRETQLHLEISQAVLAADDLNELLDRCLERIMAYGSYDLAAVRITGPTESSVQWAADRGYRDPANIPTFDANAPVPRPRLRHLSFTEPVLIEDLAAADRFRTLRADGVVSAVWVPIRNEGEYIGHLLLGFRERRAVPRDETRVLSAVGSQIGIAAQKARLLADTRRAEAERQRVEEQLRQSQKMEAVGVLAGGIAHDFNNLLTVINGFSGLLADQIPAHDPGADMVRQIQTAGERAAELTSQLLAFSRRQILKPRVVSLNTVVTETGRLLQRVIGEDIRLDLDLELRLHPIKADPGQLSQVLVNLATNARDAMPTGGTLTISTRNLRLDSTSVGQHADLTPGSYAVLTVSDTGAGMDPEIQCRIFEPFFTTKEPGKGTGLGLAMVYGIVKQSGGDISVHSQSGRGTTFTICLPHVAVEQEVDAPPPASEGPRGSERVLVVEDEPGVRELAWTILARAGYAVAAADGPEKARAAVSECAGGFDLLLTDVVMPGGSGVDLTQEVTASHPRTKVLYMSGYSPDVTVRHGILESSAAYLQKPFSAAVLLRKVRELLDAPAAGPAGPTSNAC